MTRYFYDTEFLDDGNTIELISIGIVCEDGREYYAVNADFDLMERAKTMDDWLWENVVRHLPTTKVDWEDLNFGRLNTRLDMSSAFVKPKWVIANEVREFIINGHEDLDDMPTPELWAYYAAYDHVALAQLWGPMIKLPKGIPMWTHDLMQLQGLVVKDGLGHPCVPGISLERSGEDDHNALADARWNQKLYQTLVKLGEQGE